MTPLVWILALALYSAFWAWYVGFRPKIRPDEVEATMQLVREQGFGTDKQRQALSPGRRAWQHLACAARRS